MNKEEILARSRNENKGMDIMELQSLEKQAESQHRSACCYAALSQSWRSL